MKLYTFYTETHKSLYDNFFIPSWEENNLSSNFELITLSGQQFSETGNFNSQGTLDTWDERLSMFLDIIEDNYGDFFIYSDCDVQFFGNFYDDITSRINENTDMLAQSDMGTICAGFMVVQANKIMKKFFEKIKKELRNFSNDQMCINHYKMMMRSKLLPEDLYFTIANSNGGTVWTPQQNNLMLPENMLVHHGNYTIGIENKTKLMEFVKQKMKSYE